MADNYTRQELFDWQRIAIWSLAMAVVLGVCAYTVVKGRERADAANRLVEEGKRKDEERARQLQEKQQADQLAQKLAEEERKRFQERVKTLDKILNLTTALGKGYISGKMVVIDKKNGGIESTIQSALPANLVATKADEIGTVVWIERGKELITEIRYYVLDHRGNRIFIDSYNITYKITVIDLVNRKKFAHKKITGADPCKQCPPPSYVDDQDNPKVVEGDDPWDKVVDYLKELPLAAYNAVLK